MIIVSGPKIGESNRFDLAANAPWEAEFDVYYGDGIKFKNSPSVTISIVGIYSSGPVAFIAKVIDAGPEKFKFSVFHENNNLQGVSISFTAIGD